MIWGALITAVAAIPIVTFVTAKTPARRPRGATTADGP
jgi:hypothetical protein